MKIVKKTVTRILSFTLIANFLFFTQGIVKAYDAPSWWNGDTCDSTYFNASGQISHLLTTWNGVQTCGYGPTQGGKDVYVAFPTGVAQYEWQCVELVKRYLYLAYGVDALGNTNGDNLVTNYANRYPEIFRAITNNGNTQEFPKIGDVLSYSNVHTAIVSNIIISNQLNGDAILTLVEQNAAISGTTTQKMEGWIIRGGIDDPNATRPDTVIGWLTPRSWNVVSSTNPPGNPNILTAVTSTSSNDVWAVGYNYNSGAKPLAIHWDGSTWGSNAINGLSGEKTLHAIVAISSSNILAVGNSNETPSAPLAMHYNGSTWSSIPSDAPGTNSSGFSAVGSDSSGNSWAVGDTYNGGNSYNVMIQQYAGSSTGFQNWSPTGSTGTIPNLSGTTNNSLQAVSVISANDGWSVGEYYLGNTIKPLVYRWDGLSWTPVDVTGTIPSGNTSTGLQGVLAISSNNVWAVGYTNSSTALETFIIHWDGSNWSRTSSPNPGHNWSKLNAISVAGNGTIYAVGSILDSSNNHKTLVLRYDGSQWGLMTSENPNMYTNELLGVTAKGTSSGDAWAVGDYYTGSAIATLTERLH